MDSLIGTTVGISPKINFSFCKGLSRPIQSLQPGQIPSAVQIRKAEELGIMAGAGIMRSLGTSQPIGRDEENSPRRVGEILPEN